MLRALKLGDLLCAVPVFRALRGFLPQTEIVLVGLPWASQLVERYSDYLDGFREFPGFPGLPEREPELARIPEFLRTIQAEHFDLAVQLHGSGSFVNPLTVLFGARYSAGFYVPGDYCPDAERYLPWPSQGLEIHRLLRLVEFLGFPTCGEHLEFPVRPADYEELAALPGACALRPGTYVCVHPGASVSERRWPVQVFIEVAQQLVARGFRIVLTGTASERGLTQTIQNAIGSRALDFAGRTSLGALGALICKSRLLVCNDTGVSHLAAALLAPSVILTTGDNAARWAPPDRRHRTLCNKMGVGTAQILAQADELLKEYPFRLHDDGSATRASEDACSSHRGD